MLWKGGGGSISIHVHVNPIFPVEVWRIAVPSPTPVILALDAGSLYRGADESLARPGRKQATATEDFEFRIYYL